MKFFIISLLADCLSVILLNHAPEVVAFQTRAAYERCCQNIQQ